MGVGGWLVLLETAGGGGGVGCDANANDGVMSLLNNVIT